VRDSAAAAQYKSLYRRLIGILYPLFSNAARGNRLVEELGDVRLGHPHGVATFSEAAWHRIHCTLDESLSLRRAISDDSAFKPHDDWGYPWGG
jgi:hypothetical protein